MQGGFASRLGQIGLFAAPKLGNNIHGKIERMAVEEIILNGQKVTTLRELLRPGLKAVFVGLNPAPISVNLGHYYQGRHGRRFWKRLREYHIAPALPLGAEDDAAFAYGYGFTDLVRRPTGSSKELTRGEMSAGVNDLGIRLSITGDHPLIVFTYKDPWTFAGAHIAEIGYGVLRMPGPFMEKVSADAMMKDLQIALCIA
jgi:TDG/mug DNA glycosylase family protein